MGTTRIFCKWWQPENLFKNLRLSCLKLFLLIALEYSGYKNNVQKFLQFVLLIFFCISLYSFIYFFEYPRMGTDTCAHYLLTHSGRKAASRIYQCRKSESFWVLSKITFLLILQHSSLLNKYSILNVQ
jgi:hypothetical protein